ncbi:sce7726 family protein [Faecalicoccus pleomorphus]|uniref:sce7726 family protein n=1 Tax=Faecalicoccus pleomorphus TaxID=1323 RepID=UPI00232C1DD5|nr:sce7726 family protein [Faecalicoccus pleomorphus]MDB7989503.1 sce7726 family protein [Faecalicoccus pleomorphus]MDB7993951.1 sce7726 family protein [Faecalicoccus pleomorphus]
MSNNNLVLNRFFTQYVFSDLVTNHTNSTYCTVVKRYLKDEQGKKNSEVISQIYKYMSKNYRNEYFYQNTMLNKLLLGRHSLNTTTALTQIPIGKSKADFIMINGKAVVYEIKTELDSFERLNTQLDDYFKAFNYVCVVTCESSYEKISKLLENTSVGICILTNRNTLQFPKEPVENNDNLSHKALFKILHKKEFEEILKIYFGVLPQTTQVFYYDECFRLFSSIPISILYPMVLVQLKKRNRIIKEYYQNVPYELKSLLYFYNAKEKDYLNFSQFLNDKYRG